MHQASSTHATNSLRKDRMSLKSLLTATGLTPRRNRKSSTNDSIDVDVTVAIVDGKPIFSYDGKPKLCLEVGPGLTSIRFHLPATLSQRAQFLSNPINWVTGLIPARPLPDPGNMTVQRAGDDMCTILDENLGIKEETFFFLISVMVDGHVYTSPDPTILNRKTD